MGIPGKVSRVRRVRRGAHQRSDTDETSHHWPKTKTSAQAGLTIEMQTEARRYARLALEVLRRIAEFGESESASVSAASSLLDRGFGTVGTAKVPDEIARSLGKREQLDADAKAAATGIFAPPGPPSTDDTKH